MTTERRARGKRFGATLGLAAIVVTSLGGCGNTAPAPAATPALRPVAVRLDHLRRLALPVSVHGHVMRAVALYANAPGYAPVASPARDGAEGVACVDDAARAIVVFARDFERTRDPRSRADATALIGFVVAMEQGDGEWANFVRADGTVNDSGPTSARAFSYWAARALWALGEAVRVLPEEDTAPWRAVLDRAVARFGREVASDRLVGGSATATAEALLGLLAYQSHAPSPERAELAAQAATQLARLAAGDATTFPYGARTDGPLSEQNRFHAWGARSVEALAVAARVLGRADLADAARREADGLFARALLAGGALPAEIGPGGAERAFPQIAYGVSPVVGGLIALARATGEARYSVAAGLAAAWLLGANPAGIAMYDEATGRTFDGIDAPPAPGAPPAVNRNAGAESTVEALLALELVAQDPIAAAHVRDRPADARLAPVPLAQAPARREFVAPGGARVVLERTPRGFDARDAASAPVELTYWPAANPIETRIATRLVAQWNARHPDVHVRVQPLPAGRSSEEVLLAAIVARATPDVCSNISSALLARLARARGIVRLDTLAPTAARLAERTREPMLAPLRLADGGLYAFPWKTNPTMMLYNATVFEQAGLSPPRTHSELLTVAARLARDTDGDGRADRWAMWAPVKTTWFERFYDFYPLYLAGSGGRTMVSPRGEVLFENAAAVAAFDVLRRGFARGSFPRSNFEGRDPFVEGTVALKIVGPWFIEQLERLRIPGLRYGVTPIPVPDGQRQEDAYAFGDMKNIVVFATSRHPDAAARFVAYLTSPEADRLLIETGAQLPYRRDLADDPRFAAALHAWPTLPAFAALVERTRDIDSHPAVVEVFDIVSEAYEASAIYDRVPPARAVHDAAREADRALHAP